MSTCRLNFSVNNFVIICMKYIHPSPNSVALYPLRLTFATAKSVLEGWYFLCMIFSFNIKKYWDFVINFIGETTQTLRIFSISCLKKFTSFSSHPYCPGISWMKQADKSDTETPGISKKCPHKKLSPRYPAHNTAVKLYWI